MLDTAPTSLQDLRQQQHARHTLNAGLYRVDLLSQPLTVGRYQLLRFTHLTDSAGDATLCVLAQDSASAEALLTPDYDNGWCAWRGDQSSPLPAPQALRLQRLCRAHTLRQQYWTQLQAAAQDADTRTRLQQPQWHALRQRVARMRLQFMLTDDHPGSHVLRCLCVEAENEVRALHAEQVLGEALWDASLRPALLYELEQDPARIAQARTLQPQLPLHSQAARYCWIRTLQQGLSSLENAGYARSILQDMWN